MKLYEMNEQLQAIDSLLADSIDGESNEILESAREQLLSDINIKIEHILEYVAHCKSRVDYLKDEENRLANKRKSVEKRIEYLKGVVMGQMKQNGLQKAEYGTYNVSIAKTPAKVVLTDDADELLPDNLCTISRVPNKTAIKEYMGDDTELAVEIDNRLVVVARLDKTGENLRIK
jgi:hypothetical protein